MHHHHHHHRASRAGYPLALAAVTLGLGLLLAACGGSTTGSHSTTTTAGTNPGSTTSTQPHYTKPAGTLPTEVGGYGQLPLIQFPDAPPPPKLVAHVITSGKGPAVPSGSFLVANYVGQLWRGAVFDSSFQRHVAAGFQIGAGKVIPGWDKTLVGLRAGTRVLLSIPPADGYGSAGQSQAGIPGNATLVFVVDLIASYPATATGDLHAVPQTVGSGLPVVSGPMSGAPKIKIPAGVPQPKTEKVVVLDRGHGAAVAAGFVVLQYVVTDWKGSVLHSTWQLHVPEGFPVDIGSERGPFDQLLGIPVGSRVLLELPPTPATSSGAATPSYAVVADILGQAPSA